MALVQGKYTLILDSDDLISETCFEKRVSFMEEHPEFDYASFPGRPFIGTLGSPETAQLKTRYGVRKNSKSIPYNLLNLDYPFTVWTNIYKTDRISNVLWDEKIYVMQDLDWMLSCHFASLKHGYCILSEADYYYRYFSSGNNVCADFSSPQKCQSTLYLCEKIRNEISSSEYENLKKVYHKFVVRQFQRIIQGRNKETTYLFLDNCNFIDTRSQIKLRKVANAFFQKKTNYDALRLYFLLCVHISPRYYWWEFAHSLISYSKGVEPPFFT
jgi:hypothetical protein